jgi:predicted transcriptional regulator
MIVLISYEVGLVNKQSYDLKNITGSQIRAARALLGWTAADLAREAMLGVATVRRAELVDGPVNMTLSNLSAIFRTFESAGVDFIAANGGGPGVRLRS